MQISSNIPDRLLRSSRGPLLDSHVFRSVLRKASVWLILPTVVVGGAVLAGNWSTSQLYQATAHVELGQGAGPPAAGQSGRGELQLIRALARRVMAELPLGGEPEFQRNRPFDISRLTALFGVHGVYGARKGEAQLVDTLSDRLTLHPSGDGRSLSVSFVSENPRIAEGVAERVAQAYVDLRREAKLEQLQDAAEALSVETATMRRRIEAAQAIADPSQATMLNDLEHSVETLEKKRQLLETAGSGARLSGRARAEPIDKQAARMTTAFYAASAAGMASVLAFMLATFVSLRPQRPPVAAVLPRTLGEAPAYEALCQIGARVMRAEDRRCGDGFETGDTRLVEPLAAQLAARDGDGKGLRILVATSAAKESSTVSIELARSLAGHGRRAVVLEASPKRTPLGQEGGPGLSELVASSASFADVIHRDPRSRVHYIGCGMAPLPACKTLGDKLSVVIDALALTYDFVILCGPSVDEAAVLATLVDAAILVTADSPTSSRTVAAYDQLAAYGVDDVVVLLSAPAAAQKAVRIAA